ncbi:MAG TPA: hypothetical protein VIR33_10915 [Thermopolyspora sp.]
MIALLVANTAGFGYLVHRQQEDGKRIQELTTELAGAGSTIRELESSLQGARQIALRAIVPGLSAHKRPLTPIE